MSLDVTTFGAHAMHAWVAQLLATYGYGAVALVLMGESLGLPRPGETRLLLGGASASAGYLESWGVILAAAGGAMVGDTLGYELGRWGGRPFLERYGHIVQTAPKFPFRWWGINSTLF